MSVIEVQKLIEAVSAKEPSGANLEYDPKFVKLVQSTQGKPGQEIGGTVVEAEGPNWRAVKKGAVELFGRSKDLRLAVYLTQALLSTDGFPGLSDGLALVRGLLEKHWETLHPQLDPDDGNDPTMRVNTLASLYHPESTARDVRETPLVSSRGHGRFSLRDILIATGKLSVPAAADAPPPEISVIDAAFMDVDLEALQGTADAVAQSIEHTGAIESILTEKVGVANAQSFDELVNVLKAVRRALAERLARRGVAVESDSDASELGGVQTASAQVSAAGEIASREDAVRVLEKVCDYFARHEPSSPVPLLLSRAKRLVSKNFVEIVRDLAPDGLTQVEGIRGTEREES
jgi:type VI secretion system protein ImpA